MDSNHRMAGGTILNVRLLRQPYMTRLIFKKPAALNRLATSLCVCPAKENALKNRVRNLSFQPDITFI